LVKDVPRHEVEWDEVRDQSVCQPCIRMIWLCANQKESLLRGHFIDLDLPILCQLTLHCVQKWESPLPVDLIRMRMDPGLQPDPVELCQISRGIRLMDQLAQNHLGTMFQVAGLIYPGRTRQFDPTRFQQEAEHPFMIMKRQIA